jgi:signal transduction histidine kinase
MEGPVEDSVRSFEAGQRRILERAARGTPLPELLRDITLLIERQRPGHMTCSVLLLDRDHACVRHGAAPNLPPEFVQRIDGARIGPQEGSCGTAAYAHDFNNILTAILGNATLGKTEAPSGAPLFEEIEEAGARAMELVRQILTFSRDQPPKREVVNVAAVVDEALRLVRATAPKTVTFGAERAADVPAILADPTQVHQVIVNLCTNATHAIGDGKGRVQVRLERAVLDRRLVDSTADLLPGTYARIVVEDDGAGMDEATLEHIFEPYFTTKEPGKGTGLGLAVVHGIMKGHQGGIVVRSAPGAGTTFTLYFPAAT